MTRERAKRNRYARLLARSFWRFRGGLDKWFGKVNLFSIGLSLFLTFGRFGQDLRPFLLLFNFPSSLLPFPVWRAIVPEVEVNIKELGNDTPEPIDVKTHRLGENRDTEMVGAQEFHVKAFSFSTQTRLEG